ncbi:uncharacterized protein LOC129616121 [Condylostylus longicornis]|uniref:uncharacterized protein LOC129616121 n=1 Tax=Condylostylus longicornis TaxID=2530218 RepID=UPI00244DDBBB|nr:uncharacterized protein LOC129616121 [Condylostylus longicornis]
MVKSFFGFRLNTAALFIGWVGGIIYLISAIVDIVCLANLDYIVDHFYNNTNNSIPFPDIPDNKTDLQTIKTVLLVVLIVYLVLHAQNALSSILLVIGTLKERHLYLVPWLINNGIYIWYFALVLVGMIIHLINLGAAAGDVILSLVLSVFAFVINFYVWLSVYSLYKIFQSATDQQRLIPQTGNLHPSYTRI